MYSPEDGAPVVVAVVVRHTLSRCGQRVARSPESVPVHLKGGGPHTTWSPAWEGLYQALSRHTQFLKMFLFLFIIASKK